MTGATSTRWSAVRSVAQALRAAGIETPGLDARMLVCHALRIESHELFSAPDHALTAANDKAVAEALARRLGHEPVSRIVGERWFFGRRFAISRATLDPRPESELLIHHVVAFALMQRRSGTKLRILDAGTGSGCLLLTLLAEIPEATGVGIDISAEALNVAATNASTVGIAPARVAFHQRSATEPWEQTFNVIIANPPYIPTKTIDDLAPEVRDFDPRLALDGGADGLDCYRSWLPALWGSLDKSLGNIVFEVGEGQAAAVVRLLKETAGKAPHGTTIARDLGGIERCVALSTQFGSR